MPMPALASPRRIAAALSALALAAGAAAPSARASFPGHDGKLVYGWFSFSESEDAPYPSRTESAIRAVAPGGGAPTTLRGCVRETGRPDVGDCSIGYGRPAVSPNGRLIAFDAGNRLALMRFDGAGFRLLPAHSADDADPAFSPSGKRLALSTGAVAVASQPAPPRGVWTSDLAGGDARQVTALGTAPSWSTRNWIAFLRADGVYRIRPDGHGLRRIVPLHRCSSVDWSPGGTKLAFTCRDRFHIDRLYVADGDGRHLRRIAARSLSPEAVAWAPSGKRLAATSFGGTLATVRLDGSHERALVAGEAGATYSSGAGGVDWQSRR